MSDSKKSRILYKDEYLAVFNKNNGEICESWTSSCKESKQTYVPEAFLHCLDNDEASKPSFCQCFNRLDRPVSGANLIIFDKNIFPILQNQFTNSLRDDKSVKKVYWAIVEGIFTKMDDYEHIEHYLRFDATKQKSFVYDKNERKTKKAQLEWRSMGHGDNYSFLEIRLLTGRTHQIRSQLAHMGMKIKGDVKYGARRQDTIAGIRLHARHLEFIHPKTKKNISVFADLPVKDPLWQAFENCV